MGWDRVGAFVRALDECADLVRIRRPVDAQGQVAWRELIGRARP